MVIHQLSRWLDIGLVHCFVFMDRDGVEVHKLAKKERGQYLAILTEKAWPMQDLLYSFHSGKFSSRDTTGSPEQARYLHFARSGNQSQHKICFILPAHRASHIIRIV